MLDRRADRTTTPETAIGEGEQERRSAQRETREGPSPHRQRRSRAAEKSNPGRKETVRGSNLSPSPDDIRSGVGRGGRGVRHAMRGA